MGVAAATGACSGTGGTGEPIHITLSSPAASSSARTGFDPPTRFDAGTAVTMPAEAFSDGAGFKLPTMPVTLSGAWAFVATTRSVLVVNTATGASEVTVKPEAPEVPLLEGGSRPAAPILAHAKGRAVVVAPIAVRVRVQGTTPGHDGIAVFALDQATGALLWSIQVPIPEGATRAGLYDVVRAVGADGPILILTCGRTTYGIDLNQKTLVWTQTGFQAQEVTNDLAVGLWIPEAITTQTTRLGALHTSDGTRAWTSAQNRYYENVLVAGGDIAVVTGRGEGQSLFAVTVVNTRTGRPVSTSTQRDVYQLSCWYDQASVIVCSVNDRPDHIRAWALDTTTGTRLWDLPDKAANRIAPVVSTTWHGLVYGSTENGPVILDARTGADHPGDPGIAPDFVNEYTALAPELDGMGLAAYPATG